MVSAFATTYFDESIYCPQILFLYHWFMIRFIFISGKIGLFVF